jgi:hypothetical protein
VRLYSRLRAVAVLTWARANGCPWDEETGKSAALCGRLAVLLWARTNGCPWDESCARLFVLKATRERSSALCYDTGGPAMGRAARILPAAEQGGVPAATCRANAGSGQGRCGAALQARRPSSVS